MDRDGDDARTAITIRGEAVDLVGLFRARAQEESVVVHGPVGRHGVPRAVTGIAAYPVGQPANLRSSTAA